MADVLIVDDEADLAWILAEELRADGHQVRTACDGEEGLRLLRERMPDAVLVDVEMPRLDGPAMVYQMFVRNCGMENVPIIVSSGIRDVTSVAKRIGTPYFVSKPFDTEQLLAMVRRAVAERALPRPSL